MIKTFNKVGLEGNHFDMLIKAIYEKLPTDITFNGERMKAFCRRPEKRQGCPLSPFPFNLELKSKPKQLGKKKINKRDPNRKGRSKILFEDMILYIKNPKDSTYKNH